MRDGRTNPLRFGSYALLVDKLSEIMMSAHSSTFETCPTVRAYIFQDFLDKIRLCDYCDSDHDVNNGNYVDEKHQNQ